MSQWIPPLFNGSLPPLFLMIVKNVRWFNSFLYAFTILFKHAAGCVFSSANEKRAIISGMLQGDEKS
jgi:hypothetical protein